MTLRSRILLFALRMGARVVGHSAADLRRIADYLEASVRPAEPRAGRDDLQRPREDYFPGLTERAWHDSSVLEWIEGLERAAPKIRQEFLDLDRAGRFAPHPGALVGAGEWDTFYFRSFGRRVPEATRRCPATARAIDSIPRLSSAGVVYYSILKPGSEISPHCGPTNTRLRCHLGLEVPPGDCAIRVGAETGGWKEGRFIVFDDSFEHEVWNHTDRPRVVLIVDVWHPDLSEAEVWAVTWLQRLAQIKKRVSRRFLALVSVRPRS